MLDRLFMGAAADDKLFVEDVFSTYLYTGNGGAQTIDNGIELGAGLSSGGYITLNQTNCLQSPSSSAFAFGTGDFTMEAWIYPTSVSGTTGVVSTRIDASGADNQVFFGIAAGQVLYYSSVSSSGGTVAANNWYHIACSRSGTTVRIFLNGVQVGTVTDSVSKTTTFGFVGAGGGASDTGQFFLGRISNARIVKGTALYTSNFTPSTTPLTAVSGTSLLTCQAPNLTADNSTNAFTLTQIGTIPTSLTGGPFPDATKGKGGLVWLKPRNGEGSHLLRDTVRGGTKLLNTNTTGAEQTTDAYPLGNGVQFNSNGFSLGPGGSQNANGFTFASWTFREAPKFFDVVTYTGNGANRNIAHNLGVAPGMILIKRTDTTGAWQVYHRSIGNTQYMVLNTTAAAVTSVVRWNSTSPTATEFTIGTSGDLNTNGGTYVAYLFAHDTTADSLIQCGSYTGDGTDNYSKSIELGWEPQFILVKRASTTGNWFMVDNMRGMPVNRDSPAFLYPDLSASEGAGTPLATPYATGFTVAGGNINNSGASVIYMAIRRGPMKTPTLGTSVFAPVLSSSYPSTLTAGFPVDMALSGTRTPAGVEKGINDRLRGFSNTSTGTSPWLVTQTTAAETPNATVPSYYLANNTTITVGTYFNGTTIANYLFRRAPGFFDEVCYTGTGVARTLNHNLGVVPELMIVKSRSTAARAWMTYTTATGATQYLMVQSTNASATGSFVWNDTAPTSSNFTVGAGVDTNESGSTFVAYLFASCPGVSKVGSYTGNGSSQTIDCGFAAGARFFMVKRTDSTGNWWVFDTARGFSFPEPVLALNSTAAEISGNDSIDNAASGITVIQQTATNININGATYIYLAIA
jgi:hypothetical protein